MFYYGKLLFIEGCLKDLTCTRRCRPRSRCAGAGVCPRAATCPRPRGSTRRRRARGWPPPCTPPSRSSPPPPPGSGESVTFPRLLQINKTKDRQTSDDMHFCIFCDPYLMKYICLSVSFNSVFFHHSSDTIYHKNVRTHILFLDKKFSLLWGEAQLCLPYVCL